MMAALEDERTAPTQGSQHSNAVLACTPTPHPKTGLVHCMLERSTARRSLLCGTANKLITLRLDDDQEESRRTGVFLQAHSVSAHRFTITKAAGSNSNDSSDSPQQDQPTLATLTRLQSNMTCITYGLRSADDDALLAVILYSVPSVGTFLTHPPPRHAQMAILSHQHDDKDFDDTDKSNNNNNSNSNESSASSSQQLEVAIRDSIQEHGSLDGLRGLTGVTILTSLEPYLKAKDGSNNIGMNFRGRGREASSKNMQLAIQVVEYGIKKKTTYTKIHAQMVKWDTDQYHLDYYYHHHHGAKPSSSHNDNSSNANEQNVMNPLTTFAFGIAQLDL